MILAVGFRVRGVRGTQQGTRRLTICGARRRRGLLTSRIWRNCDESRTKRNGVARTRRAEMIAEEPEKIVVRHEMQCLELKEPFLARCPLGGISSFFPPLTRSIVFSFRLLSPSRQSGFPICGRSKKPERRGCLRRIFLLKSLNSPLKQLTKWSLTTLHSRRKVNFLVCQRRVLSVS